MKKPSLTVNYLFNLGYQLLIVLVPLIVTPYVSRVLGAEGIGAYSYAQSIVSCFALAAALGTAVHGQRVIAVARDDAAARTRIFWEIFCLRVVGVGTALAVYFLAAVPRSPHPLVWSLAAVELAAAAADISWFFQGIEDFRRITVCNGAVKLVCTVGIFVFVKTAADLPIYILLYCCSLLLGNLSLWAFLPAQLGKTRERLAPMRHLRPALALFLPQVAIYVYAVLDKTMLGSILGSDLQNGYYEQAQKLQRVLLALATALGTVIIPRVANLWARQKHREIDALLNHSFRMILAIAFPAVAGIWLVADRFVPIYYGPGYAPVAMLLKIFVWIVLFAGISGVTGNQYMIPTGRENLYTRSVVLGAVLNVALNAVLIPCWQANGAALASAVAEFAIMAYQLWLLRRVLNFKPLAAMIPQYLIPTAAMAAAAALAGKLLGQGILSLVGMVAAGGLAYLAVLFVRHDPLLQPAVWQRVTGAGQQEEKGETT